MTRFTSILLVLFLILLNSWDYSQAQTLAFPGAEGFGRFATGGRGGRVIEVTNLNDSGPGSFRAAVQASGPRIVVFRVGGTINLASTLTIDNPFLTIAGQTAPGDGVMIKGGTVDIQAASDTIIRYMRIRVGSAIANAQALHITAARVIVDHCSLSWTRDDTVNGFGNNVTIQWSILSEALDFGGIKGKFMLMTDGTLSLHHNLGAHISARNPTITGGDLDAVNNVFYDYSSQATILLGRDSVVRTNFVENYYKAGPASSALPGSSEFRLFGVPNLFSSTSSVYLANNIVNTLANVNESPTVEQVAGGIPIVGTRHNFPLVTTTSATQAYSDVLARVGARLPILDAIDSRIISEVANRTGQIITDPSQVGGYPTYNSGTPPPDTDHDGMPDSWETTNGFNPNNPGDGPLDADGDGHTNVEEYLNSITVMPGDTTAPAAPTGLRISGGFWLFLLALVLPTGLYRLARSL